MKVDRECWNDNEKSEDLTTMVTKVLCFSVIQVALCR